MVPDLVLSRPVGVEDRGDDRKCSPRTGREEMSQRQPEIQVGHKEESPPAPPAVQIIKQHWNQKPSKGIESLSLRIF